MKFFIATLVSLWCVFAWTTHGIIIGLCLEPFSWWRALLAPIMFFVP